MHFPITVGAGGSVADHASTATAGGERRPLGAVPRRGRDTAAPRRQPPTTDQPGRPGRLGRHLRRTTATSSAAGTARHGDLVVLPPGVTYTLEQGTRRQLGRRRRPTSGPSRARPGPSVGRRAWYDATQLRRPAELQRRLQRHAPPLRASTGTRPVRRQNVTVDDGTGPRTVNLSTAFNVGAWMHFPITVGAGGSVADHRRQPRGAGDERRPLRALPRRRNSRRDCSGAPTLASAIPGDAQVALTWTAPASDGGSAIIDYTATASPGGASCTTASLGCSISGLTNGQSYSFSVRARNAVGSGPGLELPLGDTAGPADSARRPDRPGRDRRQRPGRPRLDRPRLRRRRARSPATPRPLARRGDVHDRHASAARSRA